MHATVCTLNSPIIAHAQQRFGYLTRSQAVLVISASERAKVLGISPVWLHR